MATGAVQWLFLSAHVERAGGWVAASAGASLALALLGGATPDLVRGIVLGIIGGGTMAWLLQRPRPVHSEPAPTSGASGPIDLAAWLRWTLANGLAFGVLPIVLNVAVALVLTLGLLGLVGGGLFVGGLIGIAQWLALRPYTLPLAPWLLATGIGWGIGLLGIGGGLGLPFLPSVVAPIAGIGFRIGLAVGIGQWLVLRPRFGQAGWWIPANASGLALGVLALMGANPYTGFAITGAVSGAISGAALMWLLRHVKSVDGQTANRPIDSLPAG
jgi:hypothetical protein